MKNQEKASVPPKQKEGIEKKFKEERTLNNVEEAAGLFVTVKNRLLDVNHWHAVSATLKSRFQIVDKTGNRISREAKKGDYITIDIPGPDNESGEGYDWVCVDAIGYDDYPDEQREIIAMRLRPVSNPMNAEQAAAHFFSEDASSSFIVERCRNKLSACYFGRNETPNTESKGLTDKLRNMTVAIGAFLVFSDLQWTGLLRGLLEDPNAE